MSPFPFGLILRTTAKLFGATIITTIIGCIIQTQNTLGEVERMGLAVNLDTRLDSITADLLGMGPAYGGILFIALGLGFLLAFLLMKYSLPIPAIVGYPIAGICAVIAALLVMQAAFEITPISSARTHMGLALHGIAGFIGGRFFARMMQQTKT